jgi:hypothetical protein
VKRQLIKSLVIVVIELSHGRGFPLLLPQRHCL